MVRSMSGGCPSTEAANGDASWPRWRLGDPPGAALDLEAHEDPALADHRRAVLVPVGVLARQPPVVVDEQLDRVGLLDDLRGALDLHPAAVEAVGEGAHPYPRVTTQVVRLRGGAGGGDDDPALAVDAGSDGGQLGAAVGPDGGQDGVVRDAQEVARGLGSQAWRRAPRRRS